MSDTKNLIIYQKHYDLMLYSFPIIGRFPKNQRYVLGQQIENSMLEIGKMIVHANKLKSKRAKLFDIDMELEKLRFLMRLTKDLNMMSIKKYGNHQVSSRTGLSATKLRIRREKTPTTVPTLSTKSRIFAA